MKTFPPYEKLMESQLKDLHKIAQGIKSYAIPAKFKSSEVHLCIYHSTKNPQWFSLQIWLSSECVLIEHFYDKNGYENACVNGCIKVSNYISLLHETFR